MTGIKWAKAGEAAEQPAMHRPVLHDKGLSSPKVRAAGPETRGATAPRHPREQVCCEEDRGVPDTAC